MRFDGKSSKSVISSSSVRDWIHTQEFNNTQRSQAGEFIVSTELLWSFVSCHDLMHFSSSSASTADQQSDRSLLPKFLRKDRNKSKNWWLIIIVPLALSYFVFCRLKDNTLETVKIADFGLSQFYRPGVHLKCDGSGTISTSAPELFVKNATYKSETYNLGKTAT